MFSVIQAYFILLVAQPLYLLCLWKWEMAMKTGEAWVYDGGLCVCLCPI